MVFQPCTSIYIEDGAIVDGAIASSVVLAVPRRTTFLAKGPLFNGRSDKNCAKILKIM